MGVPLHPLMCADYANVLSSSITFRAPPYSQNPTLPRPAPPYCLFFVSFIPEYVCGPKMPL